MTLAALEELVNTESFSSDADAVQRCAKVCADIGHQFLGEAPAVLGRAHPALLWTFGDPKVLLLGHFDTVWPTGTIDRWPFEVDGNVATGPGIFDMKAGVIQGLSALASLGDLDRIAVLMTSDEEVGAVESRPLIEDVGSKVDAVLVLEPSEKGALKIARKGQATYRVDVCGRAAHSGLNPWDGANALTELARVVLALEDIARDDTTVTPTIADAGTAMNTVPPHAHVIVDVRASTVAEQERVDRQIRALVAQTPGTSLSIECLTDRLPLEREASSDLFELARQSAADLGLEPLEGIAVGGGSDGNFTAALGTPTLDGLGAVGGGAHAEGEHVLIDKMSERAALVASLVRELLGGAP